MDEQFAGDYTLQHRIARSKNPPMRLGDADQRRNDYGLTVSLAVIPASLWPGMSHSIRYSPAAAGLILTLVLWPIAIAARPISLPDGSNRTKLCSMVPLFVMLKVISSPTLAVKAFGENANSVASTLKALLAGVPALPPLHPLR